MVMVRTFSIYVGWRFVKAAAAVLLGMFLLLLMIDYIELTRRTANLTDSPAWFVAMTALYRVPQIAERLIPFAILVASMIAYLNLSRRNELVIARAAGMSAWQFVAPAVVVAFVIGIAAATLYNPLAAWTSETAKQLEAQIFGRRDSGDARRFWLRQRSGDGQSVMYAVSSRDQGESLGRVSVFSFDANGAFVERIEAESAKLEPGQWRLTNARLIAPEKQPKPVASYVLKTDLDAAQVRESLAAVETVSFWDLPKFIDLAERAGLVAAGYRFQYQNLLARPFLLAAMVLLAAAVSLRFFRFGGVQTMVLSGLGAGFALYVLAKVTEDLSKAALMSSVTAAWLPVTVGALTGILVLLFQEDG